MCLQFVMECWIGFEFDFFIFFSIYGRTIKKSIHTIRLDLQSVDKTVAEIIYEAEIWQEC